MSRTAEPPAFEVDAAEEDGGTRITVSASGGSVRTYRLPGREHSDYLDFFEALAEDFGTRRPGALRQPEAEAGGPEWWPLITRNLSPRILYGYGDPAVLKIGQTYVLTVTSNDAPDAFPILRSEDLEHWQPAGFVFPEGQAPSWAETRAGVADFWAPEMVRVGREYRLAFTARETSGGLAVGHARSASPLGPWEDNGEPLIPSGSGGGREGGAIDAHIFVDRDEACYLFWKRDTNALWPRRLAELLRDRPELIGNLFDSDRDRRTAAFAAAVIGWAERCRPMERFFLMQPLIEAVRDNWVRARQVLAGFDDAGAIVEAMRTPIHAQRLSPDGRSVTGEERIVLSNDADWEGHLIEGPFVTRQDGRYWLFYAGNDFSTPDYGIGVAVADHPLGPYEKQGEPLLQSTRDWWGPGHPSVAPGLDGSPQLFFHAFLPGQAGYKEFRALLTIGLEFGEREVKLRRLE